MSYEDMTQEIGLADIVTFGKYKGKTYEDVFKDDAPYLIWLRDAKKKSGNAGFFNAEINWLLDETISQSKLLKAKYELFDKTHGPERPAVAPSAPSWAEVGAEQREVAMSMTEAYDGQWGAF